MSNVTRTYQHTRPVFDATGKPLNDADGNPKTETVWMTETRSPDGKQSSSRLATADEIASGVTEFPADVKDVALPHTYEHTFYQQDELNKPVLDKRGNPVVAGKRWLTLVGVDEGAGNTAKTRRSRPATTEEISAAKAAIAAASAAAAEKAAAEKAAAV
jgi:hypothetical protein